jgi:hypothetical protein
MSPNRPAFHIIRSFVVRRGPDGSMFELPNRIADKFELACQQQSIADAYKPFAKYRVQ